MKKVILLPVLLISLLYSVKVNAQYCGGSGSSVCNSNGSPLTAEGFYPSEDSLPCVVDGVYYDTVVQIRTPASVSSGGSSYTLKYITITSITNLPCGLCWALGDPNNEIQGNADGCMRVTGTSFDAPGEYLLNIVVNATVSLGGIPLTEDNQNLSSQGLRFYARVRVPNGSCPLVDTLAAGLATTATGSASIPTISGPSTVCGGGNATITAGGGSYYGYSWSTGDVTPSINVTSTGTYTVTVYENCASASASKTVTVSPSPNITITPGNTSVCSGTPTTLTASAGTGTYLWSNASTTAAITVNPSSTTTYTITVTNASNCSASSGATLTVNPAASVSVSPLNDSVCGNTSTTLTATGTGTYSWSNGATTAAVTVTPANTTTYTVTITNGSNCTASASARVVTKSAGSTISATGPTTFCTGGSVTIRLDTAVGTYIWSTGATTSSITVNQSGTYDATVTVNGCTAGTNSIAVSVGSNLTPTIVANPSLNICPGGNATLDAGSGYSNYTWSNGGGTHQTTVVTAAGTYSVTVSSGTCSGSASATVVVGNFPVSVSVTPAGPVSVCQGDTVSLNAGSGFASYAWSNGSQVAVANAVTSGDYSVTVTKNACIGVDTVHVTVNPKPAPVISPAGPVTRCTGDTVSLDAGTGFSSYNWTDGETTETIQPAVSGVYGVSVTQNGCAGSAATLVNVTVNNTPAPVISPAGNVSVCSGSSIQLNAGSDYSSYAWSNGASTAVIDVSTAGSYSVSVTQNGCSGVAAASNVSVVAKPTATLSSATSNGFGYLSASPAGAAYQWLVQTSPNGSYALTTSNGQNDTVTCGNSAAYYSVVVIQNGCSDTSSQQEVVCTGINEISALLNFTIQPNPATDVVFVNYELNENTNIKLSVIDLTGRKIIDVINASEVKGAHQHQIKLNDLSAGVYLLNFVTDNGSFNARFVKQ